jgi:GTP-binding protein Era
VAIVGRPNAGKSTLLNALLGEKLSIVSQKPQTTRHRIVGILNDPGSQIIFLDTPGIVTRAYLLHDAMMKSVLSSVRDADVALLICDTSDSAQEIPGNDIEKIMGESPSGQPLILLLNKTDASGKGAPERMGRAFASSSMKIDAALEISALKGTGIAALKKEIVSRLPCHPPYYPTDVISDRNERFFVGEIVREKVFACYREEIPYSTSVQITEHVEAKGKKDRIHAEIYVERESQKGIIIGEKGAALKKVGQLARKDIERFLGRPVFLELRVKVREKWREDGMWLKRLGYSDTKS